MADSGIPGSDSVCECTTAASTGSLIYAVPDDLIPTILQHLSASDLCHVASCCRWLREATNQDSLWRPLCQSRGWEHYGTTTDLAKIAPYNPFEQTVDASRAAGGDFITFQNDRIVTDDNTAGLTSTCRWKGVYMRAHHLDRNWATDCCHINRFNYDVRADWGRPNMHNSFVDGDLLAIFTYRPAKAIHVYDIRKETLQCVIPCVGMVSHRECIRFRDGVILVPFSDCKLCAFDALTGQTLQTIEPVLYAEFFDGDLIIGYNDHGKSWGIYVWCVKDGKLQRILTVDPTDGTNQFYGLDYKDKMVAAVYDDDHIRLWDARSGECLHKLECQGPAEDLRVQLGHNIIVGFSKEGDMFVTIIWSQDTGECLRVIHLPLAGNNIARVVNKLILTQVHTAKKFGHMPIRSLHAYNFRGELVSATNIAPVRLQTPPSFMKFGSKCTFSMCVEPQEGQYRRKPHRAVFNATPNGLVRLFDVNHAQTIWIDEISMVLDDHEEGRLLFRHY